MPAAWRAGGPSISIRTAVLPPSTRRCTRRPPLRTWPRRLGHSTFPPVRPPDFQRRGIGGSWEQDVKAFLGEVAVVGEDVGKALAAHGLHGNTVGQAIPLVQAGFIEGQASQERGTRLRQNNDIVIRKNAPGKQRSPSPRAQYPLTVERIFPWATFSYLVMNKRVGSATQVMLATRFCATVSQKQTQHQGDQQQPCSSEMYAQRVDQAGT